MQVLVVGIDAACGNVLTPLFEEDRLPTLQRIFETGASGPLESHIPPWTPSMWPSLYTGVNPGKHGVFSFLSYEGYDWEVVDATHVHEYALWELLDEQGLTSVVVNTPVTNPPNTFDGVLIPGYAAPEDPQCHPPGVLDEVETALGREYRIYPEHTDDPNEQLANYRDLIRLRGKTFRYLCDSYDPNFGFIQFQQTDTVFHEYPGETEMVRGIYEAVDEELTATLDAYDPDAVFVVSDHGIGEYDGYSFRLNTFLEEHGYVEATDGGAGMPSWVPIREGRLRCGHDAAGNDGWSNWLQRSLKAASALGITASRIGHALKHVGLHDTVVANIPDEIIRSGKRQVDFARSTAYMRARIELGVRINLAGRDPEGVVSPDHYDEVRADLINLLAEVKTPDGDPVFEEVAPREKYFEGPEVEAAVDIVTVPAGFNHFLTADLLTDPFGPPGQPWNHKRHGVFAVSGEGINADASVAGAHIFDVAPTVLAALGIEKSDRMDGEVLPAVDAVGKRTYAVPEYLEGQTAENAEIADRLANLGYLDRQ